MNGSKVSLEAIFLCLKFNFYPYFTLIGVHAIVKQTKTTITIKRNTVPITPLLKIGSFLDFTFFSLSLTGLIILFIKYPKKYRDVIIHRFITPILPAYSQGFMLFFSGQQNYDLVVKSFYHKLHQPMSVHRFYDTIRQLDDR
jgi:hypothetical protein